MDKRKYNGMVNLISMVFVLGIFMIASLILANVSTQVYKNVVLANNANFELRTSLSYIATKVRQTDTIDSIYLEEKGGTTVLVLGEEIDGERFETLIYHYEGYLCELFRLAGMEYDLDFGTQMMEIEDFDIEESEKGLLHLTAENKAGDVEELKLYSRTGR